ncbi:MAG TPA: CapA family protein [Mycobacteriales bacterium]|nr:CapA family protein [Mycobacteriales bacterium]
MRGWAGLALCAAAAAACSSGTSPQAAPSTRPSPSRSPSAVPTSSAPRVHAAVTLAFGGDVHFEGAVRRRLLANPRTVLEPVASLLRGADIAMVNLETTVSDRGRPQPKDYVFRAPASAFTGLLAGGVDVVTVANNHGVDYGTVSLLDTLARGRAAGMPVVGAGKDEDEAYAPWRTTVDGERIAILGATQVLDSFATESWVAGPGKAGLASAKRVARLVRAVQQARATSDTVVVYLHWGKEMAACPTAVQRGLARTLVDAGADVIVGSHAHVVLGSGWLGRAYVDYGLGNFLFYASGGGPTSRSGVLQLTVRGRDVTSARWRPAVLEGGRTRPLVGAAAATAVARHDSQRACTGLGAAA